MAASPCQVPYSCPVGFKRRFISAYGIRLHRMLSEAEAGGIMQSAAAASRPIDADIGTSPMPVFRNSDEEKQPDSQFLSWKEISLWMWPLFTERWRRFRTEVLALAPCPLHDRHTHDPLDRLPPPVPLLYGERWGNIYNIPLAIHIIMSGSEVSCMETQLGLKHRNLKTVWMACRLQRSDSASTWLPSQKCDCHLFLASRSV